MKCSFWSFVVALVAFQVGSDRSIEPDFAEALDGMKRFYDAGGPVSSGLSSLEQSGEKTAKAASDWTQKSYEAMKAAHRVVIHSTMNAQQVLMRDGLRVNRLINKSFHDDFAKWHNLPVAEEVRTKILQEHKVPGIDADRTPDKDRGANLLRQRVQLTKGVHTGQMGEIVHFDPTGNSFTVHSDDGSDYTGVTQDQLTVMYSLLHQFPEHADSPPVATAAFKDAVEEALRASRAPTEGRLTDEEAGSWSGGP